MADHPPPADVAVAHSLRSLLVVSFVPAFPLCIAQGVLSSHPVPAVGLVPLAVSAGTAAVLLRLGSQHHHAAAGDDDDDGGAGSDIRAQVTHPVAVFVLDVVLAASLMVVLVFTWAAPGRSSSLSMLAAYATIPLLVSFFVHLFLALLAFHEGLAVHGLIQWAAWRAVPPDCPNCNTRLRPALPEFPWLKRFWRRRDGGYEPVLVNDEEPYRDDVEEGRPHTEQPEAVDVRRKDRKGKAGAAGGESNTPWDS